jgi:hypothetical protein
MRCACGYELVWHEASGHCPLCACGRAPAEHLPVAEPAAPLLTWEGKQLAVCPGKPRSETSGKLPTLRRGSWRSGAEQPRYETRPAWGDILFAVVEPEAPAEAALAPLVPARHTIDLGEIAKQAFPVGKQAAALGWDVVPYYWQAGDGTETSALVLWRGDLRAVAYWERVAPAGWRTAGCRAWLLGSWPRALGVKALVAAIVEIGAVS